MLIWDMYIVFIWFIEVQSTLDIGNFFGRLKVGIQGFNYVYRVVGFNVIKAENKKLKLPSRSKISHTLIGTYIESGL